MKHSESFHSDVSLPKGRCDFDRVCQNPVRPFSSVHLYLVFGSADVSASNGIDYKNRPVEEGPTMDMDDSAWLGIGQLLDILQTELDLVVETKNCRTSLYFMRETMLSCMFFPLIRPIHWSLAPGIFHVRETAHAAGHRDIRRSVPSSPFRPRLWTSAGSTMDYDVATKGNRLPNLCGRTVAARVTFRMYQDVSKCGHQFQSSGCEVAVGATGFLLRFSQQNNMERHWTLQVHCYLGYIFYEGTYKWVVYHRKCHYWNGWFGGTPVSGKLQIFPYIMDNSWQFHTWNGRFKPPYIIWFHNSISL